MFSRLTSLWLSAASPSAKSVTNLTCQTAKKLAHSNLKLCLSSARGYSDGNVDEEEKKSKRKIDVQKFMNYSHPLSKPEAAEKDVDEDGIAISRKPSTDTSMKKKFFNFEPSTDKTATGTWDDISKLQYEKVGESSSRVIYDITEQMLGISEGKPIETAPLEAPSLEEQFMSMYNLKRGRSGVYDLEDLVDVLNKENALDLLAIQIPAELHFVDHMVIVTAKSQRHLNAMASVVRRVYNRKMNRKSDPGLILEGQDSEWVAMDLGNIALHIMSPSERKRVDIESLWLCGPEHDLKLREGAEVKQDTLFSLVDPIEQPNAEEAQPFDITKLYDHPYKPVWADDVLPDAEDINDENRNTYTATSVMEINLRKHNGEHARKFRGRFRK